MGLDRLGCLGLPACLPACLPAYLPPRVARQATGGARARSSCLAPSGEERSPPGTKLGAKQTDARLRLRVNLDPGASLRPSHRGPAYRVLFISISFGHSRQIRPPHAMNRNVNVASLLQGVEARRKSSLFLPRTCHPPSMTTLAKRIDRSIDHNSHSSNPAASNKFFCSCPLAAAPLKSSRAQIPASLRLVIDKIWHKKVQRTTTLIPRHVCTTGSCTSSHSSSKT